MNYSQRSDQFRGRRYGSANVNSIPWETDINRDAGYPVYEMNSRPPSRLSIRGVVPGPPTPNAAEINRDDPALSPSTPKHHGCGYTFYSWLPEVFCCILGILAFLGQTRAPLRILAS
jgi:hypothetical protein